MSKKRIILAIICIIFLMSLSSVYAVDIQGTYFGSLTSEGGTSITITIESEAIEYIDYYSYEVNLNKDQKVDVSLEVPSGADFDLFFCTANMSLWWYNLTDVKGQNENQLITVPESGDYLFIVANYVGSGGYTLSWNSTNVDLNQIFDLTMILSAIVIIIIAIIIVITLLMRKRKRAPPSTIPPPPPTA